MRILLTRAPEDAARTAEKLKAQGHEAVISPVFEIQPRDAEWPKGVIDAVVATSAQAFEQAQFAENSPLPEAKRLFHLFLVGEKTAEAAKKCGFIGESFVAKDAKELADAIVPRVPPRARLVYLAGRDRKTELETRCKEARLDIIAVEIYEARAADSLNKDAADAIKAGQIDAVMHFSRRSTETFLNLAEAAGIDIKPIRHIAISADAASPLQAANAPHVAIAFEPKEAAMLALLGQKPVPKAKSEVPADALAAAIAAAIQEAVQETPQPQPPPPQPQEKS
ncbi:MAG TPA: uroporphyrinogen-III synthase [Methylovirgula sp.]